MKKFFVPILLQYNLSLINSSFIFSYIHLTTFPYSKQSSNIQFIREWRKIWHDGNRPLYRVCRRCPHASYGIKPLEYCLWLLQNIRALCKPQSGKCLWLVNCHEHLRTELYRGTGTIKKDIPPWFHQHLVTVGSDEILRLNVTLDLLEIRLIEILLITDTIYL